MLLRRFFFLMFVVVALGNGDHKQTVRKKVYESENQVEKKRTRYKVSSRRRRALYKERKEIKRKLNFKTAMQIKELKDYHIKIFETSFFLYKVFNLLKQSLWEVGDKLKIQGVSSDFYSELKEMNKKQELVILIESFEVRFKEVFRSLKGVVLRLKKNHDKKVGSERLRPEDIDLVVATLKKDLGLATSFARLIFARKLSSFLGVYDSGLVSDVYLKAIKRIDEKNLESSYGKLLYLKDLKQKTCLNFDSATVFSPQAVARIKLLSSDLMKLLETKKSFKKKLERIVKKQDRQIKKMDRLTECLDVYQKIYKKITKPKISRIKKFVTDDEYKRRKVYLKNKVLYIASSYNRKNKQKEEKLVEYFLKKSRRSSNLKKVRAYLSLSKSLKKCFILEDRFLSDD